jgi:hypothetical protein
MRKTNLLCCFGILLLLAGVGLPLSAWHDLPSAYAAGAATSVHFPTPTYDPLATPALPEHPSEYDLGKYQYYFDCMPCHGDLGQGLTDAFRAVWVEDHQNCWGRGCHGGRVQDEGFPIPTYVPDVISSDDTLNQFGDFGMLEQYLHDTHPPQYPGKLEDRQYQDLAVYLWDANHKPTLTPTPRPSPTAVDTLTPLPTATHTATPSPLPSPTSTLTATPQASNPAARISQTPEEAPALANSPSLGLLAAIAAFLFITGFLAAIFLFRKNKRP